MVVAEHMVMAEQAVAKTETKMLPPPRALGGCRGLIYVLLFGGRLPSTGGPEDEQEEQLVLGLRVPKGSRHAGLSGAWPAWCMVPGTCLIGMVPGA